MTDTTQVKRGTIYAGFTKDRGREYERVGRGLRVGSYQYASSDVSCEDWCSDCSCSTCCGCESDECCDDCCDCPECCREDARMKEKSSRKRYIGRSDRDRRSSRDPVRVQVIQERNNYSTLTPKTYITQSQTRAPARGVEQSSNLVRERVEGVIYRLTGNPRDRNNERRRIEDWIRVIDDFEDNERRRRRERALAPEVTRVRDRVEKDRERDGFVVMDRDDARDSRYRSSLHATRRDLEPLMSGGRSPGNSRERACEYMTGHHRVSRERTRGDGRDRSRHGRRVRFVQ